MTPCKTLLPLLAVAVLAGYRPPAPPYTASVQMPPELTLQHATLINPNSSPIPNANVVIRSGRITCAGTPTQCPRPAGSQLVDLTGSYIGPGLIDAHVHYSQTGWVDGRPDAI